MSIFNKMIIHNDMKKKNMIKKTSILVVSILLINSMSLEVLAQSADEVQNLTVDEAKAYLETYREEKTNELGKTYTIEYEFASEIDLNRAAQYIVENGIEVFNRELESQIEEKVQNEDVIQTQNIRAANPLSAVYYLNRTESSQRATSDIFGRAYFDTLGSVEYILTLKYTVLVNTNNGTIQDANRPTLLTRHMSGGGALGDYTIPMGHSSTGASATANYYITKSVEIGLEDFSFSIKTEQTQDWFVLYSYFE